MKDKSEEELLSLLADPSAIETLASDEAPAEEVAAAEETPVETPAAAKPEETPKEPEPEPDVDQLSAEIWEKRLQAAEETSKRFESLAGRNAGEVGFLRQKIRELETRLSSPTPDENGEAATYQPEPERRSGRDPVAAYVVAQAVPTAVNAFEARHPDAVSLAGDMGTFLTENKLDLKALAEGIDPTEVAAQTEHVLSMAYDFAKSKARATEIAQLETKRAEMFTRLKDRKQSASTSAPGSTPAPKPQAKTLADLSEKELMEELQRALRG